MFYVGHNSFSYSFLLDRLLQYEKPDFSSSGEKQFLLGLFLLTCIYSHWIYIVIKHKSSYKYSHKKVIENLSCFKVEYYPKHLLLKPVHYETELSVTKCWDSLHARLNSHYKAWSYKEKMQKD